MIMRILKKLIATFYTLFFFLLGAFFINSAVNAPQDLEKVKTLFDSSNFILVSIIGTSGIFMVTVSLLFVYSGIKRKKNKHISFDNPNGEVTISMNAVEDFLEKTGKNFEEVKEIHFNIKEHRNGLKIEAKTTLWEVANIPQIVEKIQDDIKGQFQTILGIENIEEITINISKIVHRESSGLSSVPNQDTYLTDK